MDPGALDFGEAWITDSLPLTFDVTNTSDVPVEVVEIRESCACTEADPDTFVLPGNSRRTITLEIDVTRAANQIDRLTVPFDTLLRPLMKDHSSAEWHVRGRVRLPFAVPGGRVELGEIHGQARTGEFELQRHPLVSEIDVAVADPHLVVKLLTRAEGREPDRYEAIWSDAAPLGPFNSQLQLTATAVDGTVIAPIDLPASGLLAGDFSWSPRQVILTSDQSGSKGESIVIRSRSGSPVVVQSCSSASEFVEVELVPSAEESIAIARVRLTNDSAVHINVSTDVLISVRSPVYPEGEVIEVPVIAHSRSGQNQ